jgi:hypothetical protein
MAEKIFTVEEAEKLIPKLEALLKSMIENRQNALVIGHELSLLQDQVKEGLEADAQAADMVNKQTELEFLVRIINEGLDSIEEMGAQPKDLDIGLVDFPAMLDGEEILLCWKYGEKTIRYYHGLNEGFAGRKPLFHED